MANTITLDEHLIEYDQWFIDNHFIFQSELAALQKVMPEKCKGVEIGTESEMFASMLRVKDVIEPSYIMQEKILKRNTKVMEGIIKKLPYPDKNYDYALMVTKICFIDDILKVFKEVHRILKKNGIFIIGFIDKNSSVGKMHIKNKNQNIFYKDAVFYDTEEVYRCLWETDFRIETTLQTVFGMLNTVNEVHIPQIGYGKGSFIVIKAVKL